jgi:glycosyltransferase involved in cell wall biosynthesis
VAGDVRSRKGAFRVFELRDRLHLARVRRTIGRAGLGDRVVFTGYVDSGEVRPWFELADAAVLPYRRIEQSGVASLAAAAGTPVIVSDIGGLAEGLGDRRWAFEPRDRQRLASVLAEFLSASPAERDGARSRMAEADMGTVVEETLASYEPGRVKAHA